MICIFGMTIFGTTYLEVIISGKEKEVLVLSYHDAIFFCRRNGCVTDKAGNKNNQPLNFFFTFWVLCVLTVTWLADT